MACDVIVDTTAADPMIAPPGSGPVSLNPRVRREPAVSLVCTSAIVGAGYPLRTDKPLAIDETLDGIPSVRAIVDKQARLP